ncbi:hypothetical protein I302_102373 [Kwoniella bestiolae CBS 10118]|uniref:HIT domain-containing protein n=1 Tax=Kwoniella bestiolae CBS 10118 TaxID=1296100 RepID=A0A1B9GEZ3_9TREE|nr:hypothetical protein I302_01064 [Kwoniella bestiolae CBS 10118]OCF29556.1 hypothetical protein I302_01064 [Kwoniella bestiolae CBS 10118]
MPSFASCFPSRSTSDPLDSFDPLVSSSATVKGCVFCGASREKGFGIVHADDELIAFHDRTPRATVHLLIIPRRHVVSSVRELRNEHLTLLNSMRSLALTLVSSPSKMGFHVPPFSSVPHLHLHVFSGKHTFIGRFKYPISRREKGEKGLGWFVTLDQVEKIIQNGGTVNLGRG